MGVYLSARSTRCVRVFSGLNGRKGGGGEEGWGRGGRVVEGRVGVEGWGRGGVGSMLYR